MKSLNKSAFGFGPIQQQEMVMGSTSVPSNILSSLLFLGIFQEFFEWADANIYKPHVSIIIIMTNFVLYTYSMKNLMIIL